MANQCPNILKAIGPEAILAAFHERITRVDEDGQSSPFKNFVPVPPELESRKDFEWRKWTNENWGDKCDPPSLGEYADQEALKLQNGIYVQRYDFVTTWGPALKWLEQASVQSPWLRLELYYFEVGFGFAGISAYLNGELCREIYACRDEPEYRKIGWKYFPEEYEKWLKTHIPTPQKKFESTRQESVSKLTKGLIE